MSEKDRRSPVWEWQPRKHLQLGHWGDGPVAMPHQVVFSFLECECLRCQSGLANSGGLPVVPSPIQTG